MEKQPGLRSWPFPHVVEALRKSQSLSFPVVKWDSWITFSSTFAWFLFSGPFLKFLFKGTSSDDLVVSVKRCPGIALRWAFKYLIAWYVFIFCCQTHYPNWVAQKNMCHLPGSTGQDPWLSWMSGMGDTEIWREGSGWGANSVYYNLIGSDIPSLWL